MKRVARPIPTLSEIEKAYFWSKANLPKQSSKKSHCWEWKGCKSGGYGMVNFKSESHFAHRISYFLLVGEIPKGLQLDHLCRNTICINPKHLEPVTGKVNSLRGVGPCAINSKKTHCKKGHAFIGGNIIRRGENGRGCRTCCYENWRRYYGRKKAKQGAQEAESGNAS